ncbi:hypothetical protein I4U23_015366 [Adineta vaga]|nr:hypothetical protein I4U23_015366 [Adineta vaga]
MMDANDFTYLDENITPYLKCGICKNPFIDPVTLSSSCQQTFCRQCIETNYETHVTNCHHCHGKSLSKEDFKSEGTVINRILNDFDVKCAHCSQENIKRENFSQHLKEICPKRIIFCSAKDVNCEWNGPYDQSDQHINTCPYEQLRSQLTELLNDKQSLVQLRNDYENLKEKSKQIEDENQMLKEDVKQMTILTQQLNDQSVENKKLEQEIILLNQQKDTLEKEFKSIQEKMNNASSELDQLNEQINRLKPFENENEQIKRENQSLQDKYEVNHLESIKCQESLQEITKQLTDQTILNNKFKLLRKQIKI